MDAEWQPVEALAASVLAVLPNLAAQPDALRRACLVADSLCSCGLAAMPSQTVVSLNLQGSSLAVRLDDGAWLYSAAAAALLAAYCRAAPELPRRVLERLFLPPGTNTLTSSRFVVGLPQQEVAALAQWRARCLPRALLEQDGQPRVADQKALLPPRPPPSAELRGAADAAASWRAAAPPRPPPPSLPKRVPVPVPLPAPPPAALRVETPAARTARTGAAPRTWTAPIAAPAPAAPLAAILQEEAQRLRTKEEQRRRAAAAADAARAPQPQPPPSVSRLAPWASVVIAPPPPPPPPPPTAAVPPVMQQARRSPLDASGAARCRACGKAFKGGHVPLAAHLAAAHHGCNSADAAEQEAARLAAEARGEAPARAAVRLKPLLISQLLVRSPEG